MRLFITLVMLGCIAPACAQTIVQYDQFGNRIGEQRVEGNRLVQRDRDGNPHGYWQHEGGYVVHRSNAGNLLDREKAR